MSNLRRSVIYILLFSKDINNELEMDFVHYNRLKFRKNEKGNVIVSGNKDSLIEFLLDRSEEVTANLLAFHKHKMCF